MSSGRRWGVRRMPRTVFEAGQCRHDNTRSGPLRATALVRRNRGRPGSFPARVMTRPSLMEVTGSPARRRLVVAITRCRYRSPGLIESWSRQGHKHRHHHPAYRGLRGLDYPPHDRPSTATRSGNSTMRPAVSSRSKTRLAQWCHPSVRYQPSPMSSESTCLYWRPVSPPRTSRSPRRTALFDS